MIKVIIVDDHTLFREGLRRMLQLEDDIEVVGEAEEGLKALGLAKVYHPDVAFIDIALPGLNGLKVTKLIKESFPDIKVIILSVYERIDYIRDAQKFGASAYLDKDVSSQVLLDVLRRVAKGETYFPQLGEARGKRKGLTPREKEVVKFIALGKTSKEIAQILGLSVKTVNTHRNNIMRKLEVRNAAGLVRYALFSGLVTPFDLGDEQEYERRRK